MKMSDNLYPLFDAIEERHWWFMGRKEVLFCLLDKFNNLGKNPKYLDIGCGTGAILKKLENYGQAIGVDISEEAIEYCRKKGCRDVRKMNEGNLPFLSEEFECLLSFDVIEHIEYDARELAEYYRILKPGGIMILTVPAYMWLWSAHDDINRHRRRYTSKLLKIRLLCAGFKIERLTYFSTFLFPIIVLVRVMVALLDKYFGIRKDGFDFHIPASFFNRLLTRVFSAESRWLINRDFLFGSSLLVVCRKEDRHGQKRAKS